MQTDLKDRRLISREAGMACLVRARAALLRSRVDVSTAEVVRELRADGMRPIVLKGPAIASWLYGKDSLRFYVDTDLLLAEAELARAERCLLRLGFTKRLEDADTPGWRAGDMWARADDGSVVDLHLTLNGVGVAPSELWTALSEFTEVIRVAGLEVEVPAPEARALHIPLHAIQHGARVAEPLDDLARALTVLDAETWTAAALLAERVGATPAFAAGLRLHPLGQRLAVELDLPTPRSVEAVLLTGDPPPGALSLALLSSAPGVLGKILFAVRKVVPSRRFMRFWFPKAARDARWLAAGYLWRPIWLLLRVRPALHAWRQARSGGDQDLR
jgi:hypothetical protein